MTLPAVPTVIVNGKNRSLTPGETVATMLDNLKIDPACVVVEVNEAIVRRELFTGCVLHDGDRVEVVRFVGGG